MANVTPQSPLYNFPLPEIENWLRRMGCEQNPQELNCWYVKKPGWEAEIVLDTEELCVTYLNAGPNNSNIRRAFPYSLSLKDIEDAVFSGP
ncbi:MAG: DUF3143 domain-containing protein [Geminocystis sp.]|nr:DUF3143 domain-containing protein [Geminocystis sp.]HIK38312.1 DUF3143 domain-containing protein [Geminocystis sp. M7585_C2015_104]MCS7148987.1 DUF3143 domain-containing protein [Geminocystis sp.]MCX8077373.1 DUF3143 domain-containing protein [Geminocystis sp.]MDW8114804.1 DUF3143 domain-containing protein [Geminocystis sp.]